MADYLILTNQTTNATSSFVTMLEGGHFTAEFEGTTGAVSVSLVAKGFQKRSSITLTDINNAAVTFTVPARKHIFLQHGDEVAAVAASASGTTNVSLTLRKTGRK